MYYSFNKSTPIILYGAAAIGQIMYHVLSAQNYNLSGFIDKRASEMESYCNLPVWDISNKFLNLNSIVIVSVKNVFEHEQIVNLLIKRGFHNLIYKSANVLNNCASQEEIAISNIYDAILDSRLIQEQDVSVTDQAHIYDYFDHAYICREGDYVYAHIPNEFVYTNNYPVDESKWGNVNIMAFFPHVRFFKFLLGDMTQNPMHYLKEYCIYTAPKNMEITNGWKENVIRNRSMILEQMNFHSEIDPDFFLRNAPEAEWNKKGYFNLKSGKHRAAFSAAKEYKFVTLKISNQDYAEFLNMDNAKRLAHYMQEKNIELQIPVCNPMFYNYPMISNEYYNKMLLYYSAFIMEREYLKNGNLRLDHLRMVECTEDVWGISGHFSRMGMEVYKVGVKNVELFKLLSELLYVNKIRLINEEALESLKADYLCIESNSIELVKITAAKFEAENLILVCDYNWLPEIEGYVQESGGISAFKGDHFIHSVNYKRKEGL